MILADDEIATCCGKSQNNIRERVALGESIQRGYAENRQRQNARVIELEAERDSEGLKSLIATRLNCTLHKGIRGEY